MKRSLFVILLFSVFFGGLLPAVADSEAAIKQRMLKRLPTVVALLKRGAVGENNRAQLTSRGSMTAAERAIVSAENADRAAAYALIAKKTGASVTAVAKQRAAQIRKTAAPGTWVQQIDGSWVKAG